MNFSKELFRKVAYDLDALRLQKVQQQAEKKEKLFKKLPRLREIETEISNLGQTIVQSISANKIDADEGIKRFSDTSNALMNERKKIYNENNLPENALDIEYECSVCKDKGILGSSFCKCFEKRMIKFAFEESNLSAVMATQDFDHFDFSYYSKEIDKKKSQSPYDNIYNIFEVCHKFAQNFDKSNENLFLFGGVGLGKTFLSSCIAKDLLFKGNSVMYQTAQKLFSIIEDYKFSKSNDPNLPALIDRIYNSDLLIIDDLGAEMSTSFSSSALFDIINSRLLNNKSTIINTNLTKKQLVDIYSDRVASRIAGNYTQLEFFGKDIRFQKASNS